MIAFYTILIQKWITCWDRHWSDSFCLDYLQCSHLSTMLLLSSSWLVLVALRGCPFWNNWWAVVSDWPVTLWELSTPLQPIHHCSLTYCISKPAWSVCADPRKMWVLGLFEELKSLCNSKDTFVRTPPKRLGIRMLSLVSNLHRMKVSFASFHVWWTTECTFLVQYEIIVFLFCSWQYHFHATYSMKTIAPCTF